MKTITYYPLLDSWHSWMDGEVEIDGERASLDFISMDVALEDAELNIRGEADYDVVTIVLETEFTPQAAAAALAHWYASRYGETVAAKIYGSDAVCVHAVAVQA